MAFGDKAERIEKLEGQVADWEAREEQLRPFLDVAIELRTEVVDVLGLPQSQDAAMDIARSRVYERMLNEGRAAMAARFEDEVATEVQGAVEKELRDEAPAMRQQIREDYEGSDAAGNYRVEAERRLRASLSDEVIADIHAEIDDEVESAKPELILQVADEYRGSQGYQDEREARAKKAKKEISKLAIDEVLSQLDGEVYQQALKERADEELAKAEDEKRLDSILQDAYEERVLRLEKLKEGDIVVITLGSYVHENDPRDRSKTIRKTTAVRTLRLSVTDPSMGNMMVLDDSLEDSNDRYIANDAFEDGMIIQFGTLSRNGQVGALLPRLHEGSRLGYQVDPHQEPIKDPYEIAQVWIDVGTKSKDIFS